MAKTWTIESAKMAYLAAEDAGLPHDVTLVTEVALGGGVRRLTFMERAKEAERAG